MMNQHEHVCNENCDHSHSEEEMNSIHGVKPQSLVSFKDSQNLKKNRYFEIKDKYETAYILQNKKTGRIVEIKAATPYHAMRLVGWKPKQTVQLGSHGD